MQSPHSPHLFPLIAATAIGILLLACGGGGGGSSSSNDPGAQPPGSSTTTFAGGTLDELKALSASLEFDTLEITGPLSLPAYSSETITANQLTISKDGSICYRYIDCQYFGAPSVTINVAGGAHIAGNIKLQGRAGTRVTASATCNSC